MDALARLRKNGVKTFIATGRPPVHLPYLHALDGTPFDGYVTMNGQYCYLADGELLYSKYIPAASLQTLLPYIEKNSCPSVLLARTSAGSTLSTIGAVTLPKSWSWGLGMLPR